MSSEDDHSYKRMQIKVLYSFNNNPTVFLSRSKNQYSVKTVQLPLHASTSISDESEYITLGAFDLKNCVQQIVKSSPENFKLHAEDYAVYYKDITEQPDEPFVSSGVLSSLVSSSKSHLIPGRVCQNVSASFLFGDKSNASSLTLEIRLKLHTIEGAPQQASRQPSIVVDQTIISSDKKRPREVSSSSSKSEYPHKRYNSSSTSNSSGDAAVKATRTKSLPSFPQITNPTMLNIRTADKMNNTPRYDSKSVQDRFKLAPFFQAKIVDKPKRSVRRYHDQQQQQQLHLQPTRAMRTRSMMNPTPLMISSPIPEGDSMLSDSSDDTEYRGEDENMVEEEDDEEEEEDQMSPYTPQQPPYEVKPLSSVRAPSHNEQFHALPDLEELESKRVHVIAPSKLPPNHGLTCANTNCCTLDSISWRYFETDSRPNQIIDKTKKFDKNDYEGMFGPLCNACFLFLRNKGFMRPAVVVKKYMQQQRYKNKKDDQQLELNNQTLHSVPPPPTAPKDRANSLTVIANKRSTQYASSPVVPPTGRFATPTHTPSAINQVIQNRNNNSASTTSHNFMHSGHTPTYQDIHDIMNQINNFGGPLTDIDPLPAYPLGATPPMIATKSNTRVINLYEDSNPKKANKENTRVINIDEGEDKENCPPGPSPIPQEMNLDDFETLMADNFAKSSPNEWMNALLEQPPTPAACDSRTPVDQNSKAPVMKSFSVNKKSHSGVGNMPSSPYILHESQAGNADVDVGADGGSADAKRYEEEMDRYFGTVGLSSSPARRAGRNNLVMSWNQQKVNLGDLGSTPNTDFNSNDDVMMSGEKFRVRNNNENGRIEEES